MSGYSHEVLAPRALGKNGGSAFIEKPFNARELLRDGPRVAGRRGHRGSAADES